MEFKLHIKKINFFIVLFFLYNITYVFVMMGYIPQTINFAFLIICILYGILYISIKGNNKLSRDMFFWGEYKNTLLIVLIFSIITLFTQVLNNDFNIKAFSHFILYLIVPPLLAFVCINSKKDMIDECMIIIFVRCILYFLLKNYNTLSWNNIMHISWFDTKSSIYEMVIAHDFLFLEVIFLYLNKKHLSIMSMFFCMLCFKRVSFILSIIVQFFFTLNKISGKIKIPFYIDINKSVSKRIQRIVIVSMILATFGMNFLYSRQGIAIMESYGINLAEITTGRVNIVLYIKETMNHINGLGSINYYLKNNTIEKYRILASMHCDVLQLLYEVGVFGSVVFYYITSKLASKTRCSFVLLIYIFIEMIVSHMLDSLNIWIIFYLFVAHLSLKERRLVQDGWNNNTILQ